MVFLMQNGAMQVVVARSRAKSVAGLLGCVLLITASLAIIAEGSALTLVVGTVGGVIFVGFGIGWIVVLLRAGPGLVVDETGFDDSSSLTPVGRVLWADVTNVSGLSIYRDVVSRRRRPRPGALHSWPAWTVPLCCHRQQPSVRVSSHHRRSESEDQFRRPVHAVDRRPAALPRTLA